MSNAQLAGQRMFSEWTLYRKVVENDYMEHTAVTGAVGTALRDFSHDSSVLDLGCGDAEVVFRLAEGLRIGRYVGVDQSRAALDCARERLEGLLPSLKFRQAHLLEFVEATSRRFDIVLCGYALHHLSTDEKRDFFRFVRRVMRPGGVLMAYDAFHGETETRTSYLESYIDWIADEWTEIHPEEHAQIAAHMREADKPESLSMFCQLARDAGLKPSRRPLWSCRRNYHHLVRITH